MCDSDPKPPDPARAQPKEALGGPADVQHHRATEIIAGKKRERRQTTIWVFRDPRKTKVSIYHGFEGLPWAIADLVRRTNLAIERGEVPGQTLSVGDVVQACVVSYYDGEVRKPETTSDSPRFATLPYRIVRAAEGHVSAEPAIPPETTAHFKIPATVGELIPGLDEDARREVLVTLQLREAAHSSQEAIEESFQDAIRSRKATYAATDKAEEEVGAFVQFIANEARKEGADAREAADRAAEGERIRRRITERLERRRADDMKDFGFGDS